MHCPFCDLPVQLIGRFSVCPEHGAVKTSPGEPTEIPPADGRGTPSLAALPSLLAIPLAEYFDVRAGGEPKQKLWDACDAVELLMRLLVMIGLADLRRTGPLPEDLLEELSKEIERPTLGSWSTMVEAVARRLRPNVATIPEIRGFFLQHVRPFLFGTSHRRTPESSFLTLRNRLAHGGGITRTYARKLLASWAGPFEALISNAAFLGESTLVVRQANGSFAELRGPSGRPSALPPAVQSRVAATSEGSVLLVRGEDVLVLWPLAVWGELRLPGGRSIPGSEAPQVYDRSRRMTLQFTPLGADGACQAESDDATWQAFRRLFLLDRRPERTRTGEFSVTGFEDQIRRDADEVVGRGVEIATLVDVLRETAQGFVWIGGTAGIGKSYTLAKAVAHLFQAPTPGTLLLPFRFRVGDERCSRHSFLRFSLERLAAWDGIESNQTHRHSETASLLDHLRALLNGLKDGRRVLFVLDGLDEIESLEPRFAVEVPLSLSFPRVLWACAGREEAGLVEAFRRANAFQPWPTGLPRMAEADIHEMLLDGLGCLGSLRRRLIRSDRDEDGRVVNAFVQRVAEHADGLPIYVRYVVDDLLGGRLSPEATALLPESLAAYHERLLERSAIGDLSQVCPSLVGTLAVAKEPLTLPALADLLARRRMVSPDAEGSFLVRQALSHLGGMLRHVPTPEGEDGFTLFHLSLRDHVLASPRTKNVVATARQAIADASLSPGVPEDAPAARYLYRQGVTHLVDVGRCEEALGLLTTFAHLISRLFALQPGGVEGVTEDWQAVLGSGIRLDRDAALWNAFYREREHILRRGNTSWPSYKILLQLAVEHADDSPATRQAEAWIETGACDWLWFRNPRRGSKALPDPCLRVFEGHTGPVRSATILASGCILSTSQDDTLRLWSADGTCLATLGDHTDEIRGATPLPDGRILPWCKDQRPRSWNVDGTPLATLRGHTGGLLSAGVLSDGRILSTSTDGRLCVWSADGNPLSRLEGDADPTEGATELSDGRILSWLRTGALCLWSTDGALLATLEGHTDTVLGATELSDGRLLSWSKDQTLRLWSASGVLITTLDRLDADASYLSLSHSVTLDLRSDVVRRVFELADKRLLALALDGTGQLWSPDGQPLAPIQRLSFPHRCATVFTDGQILPSFGDRTPALRAAHGAPLETLIAVSGPVLWATALPSGCILSLSLDRTLRLASADGRPFATLHHRTPPLGVTELSDGRVLAPFRDGTLRIWALDGSPIAVLRGHTESVNGSLELSDGHLLSWSSDRTLRLWSHDGAALAVLEGHTDAIWSAIELSDSRLLSWSSDRTLRLWSHEGAALAVLEGHTDSVLRAIELPGGRICSWSSDNAMLFWSSDGAPLMPPRGQSLPTQVFAILSDGRILGSAPSTTLCLWSADFQSFTILNGHTSRVSDAILLADGRILSWAKDSESKSECGAPESSGISVDYALRLWSAAGEALATLEGHTLEITGATVLSDGRLLSWSRDGTMRLWSLDSALEATTSVRTGHREEITGLADGRIVSWSTDHNVGEDFALRLWSPDGAPLALLEGHTDTVRGCTELEDDRLLSWANDGTLRLWSTRGDPGAVLERRSPEGLAGARPLSGGRLLSWNIRGTLQIWSAAAEPLATIESADGDSSLLLGVIELADGRLLSWHMDVPLHSGGEGSVSNDHLEYPLRIRSATGRLLATLNGHRYAVVGATELADGRLLSWSSDGTLRLWSPDGAPGATLKGHRDGVTAAIELAGGRLLSWSKDKSLCLWAPDGSLLTTFFGHCDPIRDVTALSEDWILSCADHATLWMDRFCKHFQYCDIRLWAIPAVGRGLGRFVADTARSPAQRGCISVARIQWHSGAESRPKAFLKDGTVVVTLDSRYLFCLKLYLGASRVTMVEGIGAAVAFEYGPALGVQ